MLVNCFHTGYIFCVWKFKKIVKISQELYVTQRELMRLFEGDIKTDILNSTYCSISKEHFNTKTIFISYSYIKSYR